MKITIYTLALLLLPAIVLAQSPDEVRDMHREAASDMYESFNEGMMLSGAVEQNGSEGAFEAFFFEDDWYVSKSFGDLMYFGYGNADGHWLGSNFSLPFALDAEDHPADTVMNIFNSGDYLEDPLWDYFVYESEDAGGYNFSFDPPDLPKVDIVLYSDPDEPHYLQVMSSEVAFSESDPQSLTHRSYFYYEVDDEGRLYNARETGRDLDYDGESVNFTDYVVNEKERLTERPEKLNYSPDRTPVGGISSKLDDPITVPIVTDPGYFMVPLSFDASDETFWFVLDTGASASLFTKEAAMAAELVDSLNVSAHGHNTRVQFDIGMCNNGWFGEAQAEQRAPLAGFPVTTIPDDNSDLMGMLKLYGASGILGISPFHQYVMTLDEPNQLIVLYPPHVFDKDEYLSKPNLEFWLDVESLIYATGTLNGELKGDVVIDTGLQQELAILTETVTSAEIELEKVDERNSTVLGGVRKFDIVRVPLFELGPIEFKDTIATMTSDDRGDMSSRGLLGFVGFAMFKGARITIDLFSERMYIEDPRAAQLEVPVEDDAEDEQAAEPVIQLTSTPVEKNRG